MPSLNSYSCSVNKFSSLDCLERLLGSFVSPLFTRLGPPVSHLSSCIFFLLLFFPAELNCVFVPINLIKSLIAFANHPASSCCCCLLLSLISEITGPLLEHRATDNNPLSVCVCVSVFEKILFFFLSRIEEEFTLLWLPPVTLKWVSTVPLAGLPCPAFTHLLKCSALLVCFLN